MKNSILLGGIEAGGTKFNCVIATGPDQVLERERFPTSTPEETIERTIAFFEDAARRHGSLGAIGLASFGPVGLNPAAKNFGHITATPKPLWSNTNILGRIQAALKVPMAFDTDVNGAAQGEACLGAARGLKNYIYVTIGTGVGAGVVSDGLPVNGAMHPEIGHMRVPRYLKAGDFAGGCPFHGDCIEGLICGPSLEKRWGARAETLPADHIAWEIQAHYIALMCWNLTLSYAPERIILGGGVMNQDHLFLKVRERFAELMNNYPCSAAGICLDSFIVPPELGASAGEVGAILMAKRAYEASRSEARMLRSHTRTTP